MNGGTRAAQLGLVIAAGLAATGGAVSDDSWITAPESGGRATVRDHSRTAFTQPAPELPPADLPAFALGNRIFSTPWVEAPASVERFDGLGPYFSSRSCSGCHLRDGRGRPPDTPDQLTTAMVVKLARLATGGALAPDPHYGTQLSERAIQGITPEGRIAITWEPRSQDYPDGTTIE
ncbi:MAG TPA: di-heme oxidoredictase family protein, partial [Candidatus Udaeobacter sp.]|nr:di-heme oxidoredictase family protein [Candidatus Udaeobacter sp.]